MKKQQISFSYSILRSHFYNSLFTFQVDDGCPVHLKKGLSDKILYGTTLLLCAVGMVMNFKGYYELINPKPKDSSDKKEE